VPTGKSARFHGLAEMHRLMDKFVVSGASAADSQMERVGYSSAATFEEKKRT